ncbi:MAG: bifunctional oligoribonuclease/PAP phosphatase NrnA [bacterium]
MSDIIREVVEWITRHHTFLITSHEAGDGDSIGSQIAMSCILEKMYKGSLILNKDPLPHTYDFLPGAERIKTQPDGNPAEFDAAIVLDCGSLDRTGISLPPVSSCLNIDHHLNNDRFCRLNWVDPHMSSTSEMVYLLADALSIPLDPVIGSNLYTGILTDTGNFTYSSTTPQCLRIAAALIESSGVQPSQIAGQIYGRKTAAQILLLGIALSSLKLSEDRKIATIYLKEEAFQEHEATPADAEGVVNYPLTIGSVEVAVLFKEICEDFFKVSFRSKGRVNVAAIAEGFGGGGHHNAAGAKMRGNYAQIRARTLESIQRQLADSPPLRETGRF